MTSESWAFSLEVKLLTTCILQWIASASLLAGLLEQTHDGQFGLHCLSVSVYVYYVFLSQLEKFSPQNVYVCLSAGVTCDF